MECISREYLIPTCCLMTGLPVSIRLLPAMLAHGAAILAHSLYAGSPDRRQKNDQVKYESRTPSEEITGTE